VTVTAPSLDTSPLKPGLRVAVGLSGGADSVALTRLLMERADELGLVVHTAHLHHGLRGTEADEDRRFAAELTQGLGLFFHTWQVDTAAEAAKNGESIEEAARRLRYGWFRELMAAGTVDAVATAHTFDDQAETVLGKLLRGAWTEGLSGIHPVVKLREGRILRPMLTAKRSEVEAYLNGLGQVWREDSSNRDPAYTRNRLRHDLLPELEQWNPRIRERLSNIAELSRGEEEWWQAEVARIAGQLLLKGRPVRGGGRAATGGAQVAFEAVRVAALPVALQRRLLRHAVADSFGVSLDFEATEKLRALVVEGRSGQRLTLPGLMAERTPREIRFSPGGQPVGRKATVVIELPVPGEAVGFGWRFRAEAENEASPAIIRGWKAGDRVTLRYSSGPRKIADVLERLKVSGSDRDGWPVIEWQGQVVWMQGAELQPVGNVTFSAEKI